MEDRINELLAPTPAGKRTLFFAGKGGVGKTSVSVASAVWLADQGYHTLLLTTDPAAHLSDVLGQDVGETKAPVQGVPGLEAANIDAKQAAEDYKERVLAEARKTCSPEMLSTIEEELESPCTEEMAAFERFVDYFLGEEHDVIVFDTAPTGHTLRLLNLPMDWSRQLELKAGGSDAALTPGGAQERFQKVIGLLKDPERATFAFVIYPEATPVAEAQRAAQELETAGVTTRMVVANMVLPAEYCTTPYFERRKEVQEKHLARLPEVFPGAEVFRLPLFATELKGLERLREASAQLYGTGAVASRK